jgi:hypothetical protein
LVSFANHITQIAVVTNVPQTIRAAVETTPTAVRIVVEGVDLTAVIKASIAIRKISLTRTRLLSNLTPKLGVRANIVTAAPKASEF